MNLADLVRRAAARHPGNEALRCGQRGLTYRELLTVADTWAAAVRGVAGPGGPGAVGVVAGRDLTGYAGVLAALCAGATVVPLAADTPPERLRALLARCPLDAVIADQAGAARLAEAAVPVPVLQPDPDDPCRYTLTGEPGVAGTPAPDVAYVLFTSGSTGRPKGVPIGHAQIGRFLTTIARRYDFGPDDVFSQTFDLTFDLAFFDMFVAWSHGATLVYTPAAAYHRLPDFLAHNGITVWFSAPSGIGLVRRMGGLAPGGMPSLRWSLFCGEALRVTDAADWQAAAPHAAVENLYGPTELTIACTAHRFSPADAGVAPHGIVPIGTPFPGLDHLLLDEDGEVTDERGELCVTGAQAFTGYLDPADDADRFVGHGGRRWYRTGDLVRRVDGVGLCYLGRIDDQEKIRGYRIEPGEVEHRLRALPGVTEAVVLAAGDGVARRLVAFYLGTATVKQLRDGLRRCLPRYLTPKEFVRLPSLPLNSRGKTDRRALLGHLDRPGPPTPHDRRVGERRST